MVAWEGLESFSFAPVMSIIVSRSWRAYMRSAMMYCKYRVEERASLGKSGSWCVSEPGVPLPPNYVADSGVKFTRILQSPAKVNVAMNLPGIPNSE